MLSKQTPFTEQGFIILFKYKILSHFKLFSKKKEISRLKNINKITEQIVNFSSSQGLCDKCVYSEMNLKFNEH